MACVCAAVEEFDNMVAAQNEEMRSLSFQIKRLKHPQDKQVYIGFVNTVSRVPWVLWNGLEWHWATNQTGSERWWSLFVGGSTCPRGFACSQVVDVQKFNAQNSRHARHQPLYLPMVHTGPVTRAQALQPHHVRQTLTASQVLQAVLTEQPGGCAHAGG